MRQKSAKFEPYPTSFRVFAPEFHLYLRGRIEPTTAGVNLPKDIDPAAGTSRALQHLLELEKWGRPAIAVVHHLWWPTHEL
jgi:hypothetical protein